MIYPEDESNNSDQHNMIAVRLRDANLVPVKWQASHMAGYALTSVVGLASSVMFYLAVVQSGNRCYLYNAAITVQELSREMNQTLLSDDQVWYRNKYCYDTFSFSLKVCIGSVVWMSMFLVFGRGGSSASEFDHSKYFRSGVVVLFYFENSERATNRQTPDLITSLFSAWYIKIQYVCVCVWFFLVIVELVWNWMFEALAWERRIHIVIQSLLIFLYADVLIICICLVFLLIIFIYCIYLYSAVWEIKLKYFIISSHTFIYSNHGLFEWRMSPHETISSVLVRSFIIFFISY